MRGSRIPSKLTSLFSPRGRHRLRWWCLAWLFLCQFPIPYVHSHAALVSLDGSALHLHLHLQHHHAKPDCHLCPQQELHWHWMLPSELTWRTVDGDNSQPILGTGLLGLWSTPASAPHGDVQGVVWDGTTTLARNAGDQLLQSEWIVFGHTFPLVWLLPIQAGE